MLGCHDKNNTFMAIPFSGLKATIFVADAPGVCSQGRPGNQASDQSLWRREKKTEDFVEDNGTCRVLMGHLGRGPVTNWTYGGCEDETIGASIAAGLYPTWMPRIELIQRLKVDTYYL